MTMILIISIVISIIISIGSMENIPLWARIIFLPVTIPIIWLMLTMTVWLAIFFWGMVTLWFSF